LGKTTGCFEIQLRPEARRAAGLLRCLLFVALLGCAGGCEATTAAPEIPLFDVIYEPSGVQQLPDGRLVVIEDESAYPLDVVVLQPDGQLLEQPLYRASLFSWASRNRILGTIDDLEGMAVDAQGRAYVITSHSRKSNGKRSREREQLVRFRIEGERVADVQIVRDLLKELVMANPLLEDAVEIRNVKDDGGFNIEGLSFDASKERLLIGLRSPLAGTDAIILSVENPHAIFDEDQAPRISDQLIQLDLDGGGIRALAYDPHLGGYLIISRKPGKSFKFWFWSGDVSHSPRRITAPKLQQLSRPEGIAPVLRDGNPVGIFVVSDDGLGVKAKPGHYLLVPYDQLKIGNE
jgi:hypothetical protein